MTALVATLLAVPSAAPAADAAPQPVAVASHAKTVSARDDARWQRARTFALRQLAATNRRLAPGQFPVSAYKASPWRTEDSSSWMAGFFPGQLWLAYAATGNPAWATRARARQRALTWRRFDTSTHDVGFVMLDSFGQDARFTGNPSAHATLLDSAASLASRWVPATATLRSWDGPPGEVTVIIDNMVNLELLFWAADHGGPATLRTMALQHALTTRDQLVRPDGSTWGAVRLDERTGQRVWRGNIGGATDESTWARGQAWAVYGYTLAYRETGDPRMLEVARRTATYAMRHLPRDGVPYWDYAVPVTRRTPRDSSAGAVLASAFLELARIDPAPRLRRRYRASGLRTLRTLTGRHFLATGSGSRSVLLHGRASPATPDAGVVYGDYYLLEALQRAQLLPSRRPALHVAKARASRAAGHHPASAVLDRRTSSRWSTRWRAKAPGVLRLDLGRVRRVTGVSVAFWHGNTRATRLRILTSRTGRHWSVVRGIVSSGSTRGFETYDIADRRARFVKLVALGGSVGHRVDLTSVRVRG